MTNTAIFPDATAFVADLRAQTARLDADPSFQFPNHIVRIAHDNECAEAADELLESAFDIMHDVSDDVPEFITIETAYLTTLAFLAIGADNAADLNCAVIDPQMDH